MSHPHALDPDPLDVAYADGFAEGVNLVESERRSPLLGFVIVALAGMVVGALLVLGATRVLAAPRQVVQPEVVRSAGAPPHVPDGTHPAPGEARESAVGSETYPGQLSGGGAPTSIASGLASWYRDPSWPGNYAAVPSWRYGDRPYPAKVCGPISCVTVTVGDFCRCPGGRIIDLAASAFRQLAPLSVGVLRVSVEDLRPGPTPPPTDVAP